MTKMANSESNLLNFMFCAVWILNAISFVHLDSRDLNSFEFDFSGFHGRCSLVHSRTTFSTWPVCRVSKCLLLAEKFSSDCRVQSYDLFNEPALH